MLERRPSESPPPSGSKSKGVGLPETPPESPSEAPADTAIERPAPCGLCTASASRAPRLRRSCTSLPRAGPAGGHVIDEHLVRVHVRADELFGQERALQNHDPSVQSSLKVGKNRCMADGGSHGELLRTSAAPQSPRSGPSHEYLRSCQNALADNGPAQLARSVSDLHPNLSLCGGNLIVLST